MKTTLRVFLVLFVCTILACLIYPFFEFLWQDWLGITDDPEARIFRRVWQFTILIGLIIDRKALGLRNPLNVGFAPSRRGLRELIVGMGVAWIYLGLLTLVYLGCQFWSVREAFDTGYVIKRFWEGFYQGMLVAFLEEYIFRGLIFFSMAARWGWVRAAIVCSLIFSSLHFLEGRGMEEFDSHSWWSGFVICGTLLRDMAKQFTLFPDATGLFMVGMILCYAAHKTGDLWYAAGLHGGWVFYSKFIWSVVFNTKVISEFYIGGGRLFNGVIPMVTMLLIFPITFWLAKYQWIQSHKQPKEVTPP